MNFRVKRILLGASTIVLAGTAYAKPALFPAPSVTATNTAQTGSSEALKQAVSELDLQVTKAKKQVAAENAQAQTVSDALKTLRTEEATAAAQLQSRIQAQQLQAQYVSQTQQPPVQSVTRASGGSGSDDGGGGGDD